MSRFDSPPTTAQDCGVVRDNHEMLDRDATLPPDNVLRTLDVISTHLASAFTDAKKLLLNPEIYEDYLPGMTFDLAVALGWIPKPPRLEVGTCLGGYVVPREYYDEFRNSLPLITDYGKYFRERYQPPKEEFDWIQPTPDILFQRFKNLSELNEEEIAEKVGCSEKTLQRFKVPGYATQLSILKALADFMKKIRPAEFATLHFHELMWRQKED
jgi:hypothetical protein